MAVGDNSVAELAAVASGQVIPGSSLPAPVRDVTHDSRQAGEGTLFVAMAGALADGHDFISDAVDRGSDTVCVTRPVETTATQIVVDETRKAIGPLSSHVQGAPSADLRVIGVTGTNGKTTVTHYLDSLASSAGVTTGLIGTIETRVAGVKKESIHTTPEAPDFQRLLAEMRDEGVDLVSTEVSSHALELGRVRATSFAVAAFTNLSQDHLDFHGDMSSYLAAKRRLFEEYEVGSAVINIDDPAGVGIARSYSGDLVTVGDQGDVQVTSVTPTPHGTSFTMLSPWGEASTHGPVISRFNLENLVMASTCALAAGLGFDEVIAGIESVNRVPGRFELIETTSGFSVVVDYAHTPEGIAKAIEASRSITQGRVIVVVGAGGDRDRDKRPLMGAATLKADVTVITSDNPRSEDPASIVAEVVAGADPTHAAAIVDRREAIEHAIGEAGHGDMVLVLGRGHEPSQDIDGEKVPFDDRAVVREILGQTAESQPPSGSMDR